MKKTLLILTALVMSFCTQAQESSSYTRGNGWLLRPETGFFFNVGYQINPNLSVSAGPGFSLYATGSAQFKAGFSLDADARYYLFDRPFTPMATLKIGTYSFSYFVGEVLVGVTLKDWDFQVGYALTPGMYTNGGLAWSIGYNFRLYPHK